MVVDRRRLTGTITTDWLSVVLDLEARRDMVCLCRAVLAVWDMGAMNLLLVLLGCRMRAVARMDMLPLPALDLVQDRRARVTIRSLHPVLRGGKLLPMVLWVIRHPPMKLKRLDSVPPSELVSVQRVASSFLAHPTLKQDLLPFRSSWVRPQRPPGDPCACPQANGKKSSLNQLPSRLVRPVHQAALHTGTTIHTHLLLPVA